MPKYLVTIDVQYEFEVEALDADEADDLATQMYHDEVSEGLNNRVTSFETETYMSTAEEECARLTDEEEGLKSKGPFDGFLK